MNATKDEQFKNAVAFADECLNAAAEIILEDFGHAKDFPVLTAAVMQVIAARYNADARE